MADDKNTPETGASETKVEETKAAETAAPEAKTEDTAKEDAAKEEAPKAESAAASESKTVSDLADLKDIAGDTPDADAAAIANNAGCAAVDEHLHHHRHADDALLPRSLPW